jgi:cyclic pyranopterin phosphate synthase
MTSALAAPHPGDLRDRLGRPLSDLRLSVTDRCNFRCRYCMPREQFGSDHAFLRRSDVLSFEEIARLVRVLTPDLSKLRLTGGEPLLRKGLSTLVELLRRETGVPIALTTNGVLLPAQAPALAAAGLTRVTVSLDAMDPVVFARMTDADCSPADVIAGIESAASAGLPVKVNCVIRRGINESEILPLTRRFHGTGHTLRFIEYMDVGSTNGWASDQVLSAHEILERIDRELPLEALGREQSSDVAARYRFKDGGGELGIVASVSRPFCGDCSRLRLSADGKLFTCLFATQGTDVRSLLRSGASDEELRLLIERTWRERSDRYSEQRQTLIMPRRKPEMSYLGG